MGLSVFRGKRVLITGHTGFKGSWLSEWLLELGAEVTGYSLPPPTEPSLFVQLGLRERLHHHEGDVTDLPALQQVIRSVRPQFVFHLAAQSLVRPSYQSPAETFSTNVMGTVNVLESLRLGGSACEVVVATTDKCYENSGAGRPFDEDQRLGGGDPYSASKACAEIATAAYRQSFFSDAGQINVATARAGNVIGGGDWAPERIMPDLARSRLSRQPVVVRNPGAVRPWQHVLECMGGYLALAAELADARASEDLLRRNQLCSAFNFGPDATSARSVSDLVGQALSLWPGDWVDGSDPSQPRESAILLLSIEKAMQVVRWRPLWTFEQAIDQTIRWYRTLEHSPSTTDLVSLTRGQIRQYAARAREAGMEWCE